MFNQRQTEILRFLAEVQFARLDQLAARLGVSAETIRRDLKELEQESAIKRVRGGAVFSGLRANEREFVKKVNSNHQEKSAIAAEALKHLHDGEAIAINNGVTSMALAHAIERSGLSLNIVTNSPPIAVLLSQTDQNRVFLTGGYLRKHNKSLVGSLCGNSLENFRVDKTFLSVDGLSIQDGITEYNTEEAAVLRRMLRIGREKIILAECSKFREVAFNRICTAEEIDCIITDWNITAQEMAPWQDAGVQVIAAPQRMPDYAHAE